MQNILLLGSRGQLGHLLNCQLLKLGRVHALNQPEVDLSNPEDFYQSLKNIDDVFKPAVIVNAAAYTAVDKAETDKARAMAVNATSVGVLAEFSQSVGATLVQYSTDYVFDGSGLQAWRETDVPMPMSVYGQTKFLGEEAIRKACRKHLILRTSWVVGAHGGNFLKTMLRLAAERDSLRVVADQIGAPTSTHLLADTTVDILKDMQHAGDDDERWGTYHVAAVGETSWHSYAQHVIEGALQRGVKLKARPDNVLPIMSAEYPSPAPRPLNSRLNTNKVQTTFGLTLPTWQQGVDQVLDELLQGEKE